MKSKNKNVFPAAIVVVLIICSFLYYYYKNVYIVRKQQIMQESLKISGDAREFIIKNILFDENLIINENQKHNDIMAKLPIRFMPSDVKKYFEKFAGNYKNIKLNFNEIDGKDVKQAMVELMNGNEIVFKARFVRNSKPKIAIILDDWGYNDENLRYLEEIKYPFAVSVFPDHAYSKKTVSVANKNKKLVMLHLPMEPERKLPPEKNAIKINMSEGEIKYVLNKFFSELPFVAGVNNHQGSLATMDKRLMNIVMKTLKEKNVFFIDSLTSNKSVGFETAKEANVLTNKRDVFIDNKKEIEYNEGQIKLLKKIAKKKGYVIGIGHDDPVTLQTLQKNMPILEAEGYEFVYVSELLL
ncbi:MAG TPA: divergent polysaccharide deacetylase family protein [Candidatus Goldiibacteriota bacterium]|nr:divergent polysaccharide deacetylase family protein [Candidatus Goldiibacteriota bacterium]